MKHTRLSLHCPNMENNNKQITNERAWTNDIYTTIFT